MASTFLVLLIAVIWLRLLLVLGLGVADVWQRRRRGGDDAEAYAAGDITFIIPAFNESRTLEATVSSIIEDIRAGAQLIIVDDGSQDATFETASRIARQFASVRVLQHARNLGKPAALNSALSEVETRLTVTLDADTQMCPGANAAAWGAIRSSEAAGLKAVAVAYDVAAAPSQKLFQDLQRIEYDASLNFERRAQGVLRAISVCPGAASLWQTGALRAMGGFRSLTVTEDVDATLRLASDGLVALHEPKARAITGLPRTWRQLIAQRRRWCLGHYQSIWVNRPRRLIPLRYAGLTYLNFAALSFFLPLMLLATLLVILFEPHLILRQSLWFTNLAWILTAYGQRLFALSVIGQAARPLSFLIEPPFTAFLHLSAALSVAVYAIRSGLGGPSNIWGERAR